MQGFVRTVFNQFEMFAADSIPEAIEEGRLVFQDIENAIKASGQVGMPVLKTGLFNLPEIRWYEAIEVKDTSGILRSSPEEDNVVLSVLALVDRTGGLRKVIGTLFIDGSNEGAFYF